MSMTREEMAVVLSQHTRDILEDNWETGSGATTTVIPAILHNPSGLAIDIAGQVANELIGSTIEYISGENIGASRNVISVTSTGTITVDTAFAKTPISGDQFILLRPLRLEITAPENVAQWAGTNVADPQGDNVDEVASQPTGIPAILARLTGWTANGWSRLKLISATGSLQTRDDATGNVGSTIPNQALMVGGTDGNDLRAMLTDALGRLTPQPPQRLVFISGLAEAANTNILAMPIVPPAEGKFTLRMLVSASSTMSIIETPTQAPATGGSTAATTGLLNAGNPLSAGIWYEEDYVVGSQANYNFQVGTASTLSLRVQFKQAQ